MSKGLEAKLDEITFCHGCKYEYAPKKECPCVLIKKKLKTLEIIKRFSHYDLAFLDYLLSEGKITKEEYDLLKEVLL